MSSHGLLPSQVKPEKRKTTQLAAAATHPKTLDNETTLTLKEKCQGQTKESMYMKTKYLPHMLT